MNTQKSGNPKERAALITLSMNVLLTLFKFVLYTVSGSLAVLAEAWHSFSDIATSFMVYLAVRNNTKESPDKKITYEQWAAIGIGVFLLIVAIGLAIKFISFTPIVVNYPVISGCVFILFSVGSFLVYRYETSVGRAEKSVGLVSDGMHALTDMAASLLTGFALILYSMGLTWIDKAAAGIIAFVVFSVAVQTIVNVSLSIARRDKKVLYQYNFYEIIIKMFSPSRLRQAGEFLDKKFKIKFFGTSFVKKAPFLLLNLGYAVGLVFWLSTCVFQVAASEQAIVERFGSPLQQEVALGPGLHFKAPWPIDQAVIQDTESMKTIYIGNILADTVFAMIWMQPHSVDDQPFISGDNNYFYPYIVIHYKIKNLHQYLYKAYEPESVLRNVANQFAVKAFAKKAFYDAAIEYRTSFSKEITSYVQNTMDSMETGLELIQVSMIDVHPPYFVAGAYEMVIAALQDKEKRINQAQAYRNKNLPEAQGDATKVRKEAEAAFIEKPLRAQGEAHRFLSRLPKDHAIIRITKKRLYLAAILEAFKGREKVIIDPLAGLPEIWLNVKDALGSSGMDLEKGEF